MTLASGPSGAAGVSLGRTCCWPHGLLTKALRKGCIYTYIYIYIYRIDNKLILHSPRR